MARRGRGNRFELCMPIVVCMHSDFGFTYEDISKAFGCTSGTLRKRLREISYKSNVPHNKKRHQESIRRFLECFDEYNYSDKFEFLGGQTTSKGKAKVRCKLCGCEFERYGNFAQQHINIRCPNCWIHLNDEIKAPRDYQLSKHLAESYESGLTVAETAKEYCLDVRVVSRIIQDYGVKVDCFSTRNQQRRKEQQREVNELRANDKRIRKEFNKLSSDIDQWRKLLNDLHEVSCRKNKRIARIVRSIDDLETYEPKIATCKHCGKEWLFWPSREYYGRRCLPVYCSKKCCTNHYKTGSIPDRLRSRGRSDEYRDCITLDEVIERDDGICYLCGCETNKDDCWRDVNGYHVCGDTYPTRDHVIPIARGGTHTWENVRLACRRCNSLKTL